MTLSPMQCAVVEALVRGPLTLDEIKERIGRSHHGPTQAVNALILQGRIRLVDGRYERLR